MSWSEKEFERRQTGQERTVGRRMPTAPEKDEHGCVVGEEEWNADLHQCVKITKPTPAREQKAIRPPQGVSQRIDILEEDVATLKRQMARFLGTREQIPAQPVVPVGPITVEQKVAALNDKVAEIEKLLANLYGLTGHTFEEVKTALTWKLGKRQ